MMRFWWWWRLAAIIVGIACACVAGWDFEAGRYALAAINLACIPVNVWTAMFIHRELLKGRSR